MDGWKKFIGKKVFVRTIHERVYQGYVDSINDSDKPIIFISMTDKFGKPVMLISSEIAEIKVEE